MRWPRLEAEIPQVTFELTVGQYRALIFAHDAGCWEIPRESDFQEVAEAYDCDVTGRALARRARVAEKVVLDEIVPRLPAPHPDRDLATIAAGIGTVEETQRAAITSSRVVEASDDDPPEEISDYRQLADEVEVSPR